MRVGVAVLSLCFVVGCGDDTDDADTGDARRRVGLSGCSWSACGRGSAYRRRSARRFGGRRVGKHRCCVRRTYAGLQRNRLVSRRFHGTHGCVARRCSDGHAGCPVSRRFVHGLPRCLTRRILPPTCSISMHRGFEICDLGRCRCMAGETCSFLCISSGSCQIECDPGSSCDITCLRGRMWCSVRIQRIRRTGYVHWGLRLRRLLHQL